MSPEERKAHRGSVSSAGLKPEGYKPLRVWLFNPFQGWPRPTWQAYEPKSQIQDLTLEWQASIAEFDAKEAEKP